MLADPSPEVWANKEVGVEADLKATDLRAMLNKERELKAGVRLAGV